MKKKCLALIFTLLTFTNVFAEQKDFIVLIDTSEKMFDVYDEVVSIFFQNILKEHLKRRDLFHLISYSETSELEIIQRINEPKDIEAVIKRALLLQPLSRYSDLLLALNYTYQYVVGLNPDVSKTIIVITDGLHRPKTSMIDPKKVQNDIELMIKSMIDKGWDVKIVKIPFSNESEQTDPSTELSFDLTTENISDLGIGIVEFAGDRNQTNELFKSPQITFPKDIGRIGRQFNLNLKIMNHDSQQILLRLREVNVDGENILESRTSISLDPNEEKSVRLSLSFPQDLNNEKNSKLFQLVFEDEYRASPNEAQISFEFTTGLEGMRIDPLQGLIFIFVILLIVFIIIILIKNIKHGYTLANKHVDEDSSKLGIHPIDKEEIRRDQLTTFNLTSNTKHSGNIRIVQNSSIETLSEKSVPLSGVTETDRSIALMAQMNPSTRQSGKVPLSGVTEVNHSSRLSSTKMESESKPLKYLGKRSSKNEHRMKSIQQGQLFQMSVRTTDYIYQSTLYGRNTLALGIDGSATLGGSRSNFKIVLYPLSESIAELHYDNQSLNMKILTPEYFEYSATEMNNIEGKEIQLKVNNKVLYIIFRKSIPELEQLNTLLRRS